jgi:hypothetical protein
MLAPHITMREHAQNEEGPAVFFNGVQILVIQLRQLQGEEDKSVFVSRHRFCLLRGSYLVDLFS